jgi:hypothetical protein
MSICIYIFLLIFFLMGINLYIVATKNVLLTIRIRREVRDEFNRIAILQGDSMSGLVHRYIYKFITASGGKVISEDNSQMNITPPKSIEPELRSPVIIDNPQVKKGKANASKPANNKAVSPRNVNQKK